MVVRAWTKRGSPPPPCLPSMLHGLPALCVTLLLCFHARLFVLLCWVGDAAYLQVARGLAVHQQVGAAAADCKRDANRCSAVCSR